MDQITEFFSKLLDVSDFPPRWHCGTWSDFLGWLYIGSDIAIWLSYFIIPVIIIWFIQKKPEVPFLPVFWLFGAFILLCGSTHLIDAVIFWWPAYRVNAVVKFMTAIVSFLTVFALIRDLPKALNISTKNNKNSKNKLAVKNKEIENLKKEIAELKNKNQ